MAGGERQGCVGAPGAPAAGKCGVTPIDMPGPRWSGYVHNLRRMGLVIETIHESHGGPFPGNHARLPPAL